MRIYDITRPIYPGMPVYPGDPEVAIRPWLGVARGDGVNVAILTLGSHTGTHVDAPRHVSDAGLSLDRLSLDLLIGPAIVADVGPARRIDAVVLRQTPALDLGAPPRLLLRAGAPAPAGDAAPHPSLTEDAARLLLETDIRLVGVEAPSVDPPSAQDLLVHRLLLEAGVIIVENLDLSAVPAGEYELVCLPLAIRNGDGAPARAALLAPDGTPRRRGHRAGRAR
jgi:arylformamidase